MQGSEEKKSRHRGHILSFINLFTKSQRNSRSHLQIDELVDAGIDGFHSIEPQAMSMGYLKYKYGDRIALCGNVDCGYTLRQGTPQDVQEEANEIIRTASPGGGHLLGSSNSILAGTLIENFKSMIETARKYGKYQYKEMNG